MKEFSSHQWSLIPGPKTVTQILYSTELQDVALYEPREIAATILRIDGTSLVAETNSWWDWKVRVEWNTETFDIGMSLFEIDPVAWGGSEIHGEPSPAALLSFWKELRKFHDRVWLHNDSCQIFSPEIFEDHFIL